MNEERKNLSNGKLIFIILILFIVFIILWARFISTKGLTVREYAINSSIFTSNIDGLKIIHFSDLLYGRTVNKKDVQNLVKQINDLKPDLVVFSGNIIDKDTIISDSLIEFLTESLSQIDATLGKYAVSGDQDYKLDNYEILMKNAGFNYLNNTYDVLYYKDNIPIIIIGLPSLLKGTQDYETAFSGLQNFSNTPVYKIVLVNEPDSYLQFKDYNPDLVLSGHSLNGQVRIPFVGQIIAKNGSKTYYDEYYNIDLTKFFISGGIGTTDYSFRFFNKPSINLYRMYSKEN